MGMGSVAQGMRVALIWAGLVRDVFDTMAGWQMGIHSFYKHFWRGHHGTFL